MNSPISTPKRLYRSRTNYKIAGVCGGLGEHFEIDATWIRLLFVITFFFGGSAFLIYIILWVVVPLDPVG